MKLIDFLKSLEIDKKLRLTEQQKKVINHIDGPALTLAVPGSGKTTSLVLRTRIYTLIISLILVFVFNGNGFGLRDIVLMIINSILVATSSMGAYEVIRDPLAMKKNLD